LVAPLRRTAATRAITNLTNELTESTNMTRSNLGSLLIGLLAGSAVATGAVTASDFRPARKLANPRLQKLYDTMKTFDGEWARCGAHRVTRPSDPRGRTPKELRRDTLKEALHRFSGAFLDEGVSLREAFHNAAGARFAVGILQEFEQNDERPWKALESALAGALGDRTLEVYAGSGSGNNTIAAMLCVYDVAHDQVVYLILSNFGSDS
jgi:hypothetical protein